MSSEASSDGSPKIRPILADVTNRSGKRASLLNLDHSAFGSGNVRQKNLGHKAGVLRFAQQPCLGAENLVKGRSACELVEDDKEKGLSFVKVKRLCCSTATCGKESARENLVACMTKATKEIKEPSSLRDGDTHLVRGDALMHTVVETGDGKIDCNNCSTSFRTKTGSCDKAVQSNLLTVGKECQEEGGVSSDVGNTASNLDKEALTGHLCRNDGNGFLGEDLASNKSDSMICPIQSESSGSKSFNLESYTGIDHNGIPIYGSGEDLLKACSCSFCLKAAYIWSDLNYQDIKGRVAALKRSKKEASFLVEGSSRHGEVTAHGQGNSKSSKLELDLTGQWKSMYLHMEDILAREYSQLQSSLLTIKELRGNCKVDLEMIKQMNLNK